MICLKSVYYWKQINELYKINYVVNYGVNLLLAIEEIEGNYCLWYNVLK